MKKIIITSLIIAASLTGFSQKIGLKFTKQNVTVVPATIINTDTIAVNSIIDNGSSVILIITVGSRGQDLLLWSGADYTENANWSNETILAALKKAFNIQK
jgi:hypothetical protein